jgi:membrane-bound lytic murein transglycosylase B
MVERGMPARRHTRILIGAGAAVVAAGLIALVALSPLSPLATDEADRLPAPTWASPAALPVEAATITGPGVAGTVDPLWLAQTAEATAIPERALAAYAGVAVSKAAQMPTCGLGWNTLAAIGYAESRHGTHDGSAVGADGTVAPPILGIALEGGATERIADSDDGAVDGDTDFDRAVGPMQLIPQTWRNWHVDASGDGVEDPQNIDDSVAASANYLCRASGDMAHEAGWAAGIAAYNSDPAYAVIIAEQGSRYRSLAQ